MSVSARLKSERERLGLSQPRLAELLGVGKTTVINWEKGASAPDAVQLAAFAEAGGDVLFVVTGLRGKPVPPAAELPRPEQEWLAIYRNSTPDVRDALKAAGNAIAKSKRKAA